MAPFRPMNRSLVAAFTTAICGIAGVVALFAALPLAHSAFPGHNGRIAFISLDGGYEIFTMRPGGTHVRQLTHNHDGDYLPAFSPSGRKIAFVRELGRRVTSREILTMRADGTHQRRLTHNSDLDTFPAFSPNGRKVVFTRQVGDQDETFLMNADGTNKRRITDNNVLDYAPVFSPRGGKIAFTSNRNGSAQVFTMRPDGTHVRQLTHLPSGDGCTGFPDFGPEGKRIAFGGIKGEDYELFTIGVKGTHLRQITHNRVDDCLPAFSPNGRKIVFHVPGGGNYTIRASGMDRHRIGKGNDPDWQPVRR
jgi:Tol biopolymer transport system component